MCSEGSWNIFLPLPKRAALYNYQFFENTVVDHLHGLVGNIKRQLQQKCEDFMTHLFVADGNTDVTGIVLPTVYV